MKKIALNQIIFFLLIALFVSCQTNKNDDNHISSVSKEVYLPENIWMVPDSNKFESDASKYSYSRMRESDNFAIFWAKKFGDKPMANPDSAKRFNPEELLKEGDRIYNYYVDELKLVEKGNSITDSFKALVFIIDGDGGTAFGGGEDDKVGIFWAPPSRMQKKPFGALVHELTHSFQYLLKADGATTFTAGHAIYEMSAQYCLWQVYPEWMTFENYHLVDFMKQTHYSFLHEINMYHSPYVLEYWADKHGKEFFGKFWREVGDGEDAVMGYKRLTGIGQETFNNEIFDAAQRFITWDMKRIQEVAKPYRNQHTCKLDSVEDGWFRIAESRCPQNYGYNGIKLKVPGKGKVVNVQFKGIAGAGGFNAVNVDKAGWRYGFVACKKNGKRVYGDMHAEANGEAAFKVPNNAEYLWLVVTGAPTEHWIHKRSRRGEEGNDEQWPYEIKLSGTSLYESVL